MVRAPEQGMGGGSGMGRSRAGKFCPSGTRSSMAGKWVDGEESGS